MGNRQPRESTHTVNLSVSAAGEDGVAVPFAGEILSQEPPEEVVALAVKVSEPPPVFETCNSEVKPPLPWVAVKLIFCVSTPRAAGVPASTVSVTETVAVAGTALGAGHNIKVKGFLFGSAPGVLAPRAGNLVDKLGSHNFHWDKFKN